MEPSGEAPALVYSMERIAKALGISVRKLHLLMHRPAGERPPVRCGHRGIYAIRSQLQAWVDAQDMEYGVARMLGRGGRAAAMRGSRPSDVPPRAA